MPKVKMLVSMSGPDESWKPGDVREVSDSTATAWKAAGIACAVPDSGIVVPAVVVAEKQEPEQKPRRGRRAKA